MEAPVKTIVRAGIIAVLSLIILGCAGSRPASVSPQTRMDVPVVLADLKTGGADANAPFAVAEVGPTGTVPHENLEGGVWILFNQAVVPLSKLQPPATSSPVMTLTPKVEGIFRWYGSRLLAFEPKGQLAPATEYTITLSRSLKSLDGQALSGTTRFTFRTEPLQIVDVTPAGTDVAPTSSHEIVVTFNFPVDLKTITPFIKLEAEGALIPFTVARPVITDRSQLGPYENADRLVSLNPSKELPWDADVKIRVLAGAKPRPENYGTDAELSQGFHTLLPLAVEESEASMGRDGATVTIRFNHEVKEDTVAAGLRLSLEGYKPEENLEVSGSWVYLSHVPARFDDDFTITLAAGITDTYGQTLGSDTPIDLNVGPAAAYVDFRATGQRILESQFPPHVAVETQNVDSGQYVMGRMTDPFAPLPKGPVSRFDAAAISRNVRHFQLFDLLPFLNDTGKGAVALSWAFKGLFYGSDTPQDVKDDLVVQVTDIGASVEVGYNSILVLADSLSTGDALPDATVTLRKDGKPLATARTDAKGLASLALAPGMLAKAFHGSEEKAEIEIVKGKDRLVLRPSQMEGRTWNSEEPYAAETPNPLTYLWSDRGIYRPGETLSFAGIDRNLTLGRLSPAQGKFRVDLTNGSEDGTPIASATGSVSASGTFSGQMNLPQTMEPGDWMLTFHRIAGKDDSRTGSAYVQVANFRKVSFSVGLTLPDTRAFMGDSLRAKFAGSYLAGGDVTKGKWSWFWTRRETWYQPPGDALADYAFGDVEKPWAEDLSSESGALDGAATITASQKLADGDAGRVYTYEVTATVEDIDRQAISKQDNRMVFSSNQMLGAKLTAGAPSEDSLYFVQKGQPFTLKVLSVDPDGAPLGSGPVTGRLIREDWKLVRSLSVGGVVDTHYEKDDVVEKDFTVTPSRPYAAVPMATQKSGSYAIELTGQDAKGRQSFTRITFYATGADEIVWERTDERRIDIVPDKKIYAPGDTAHLLIKSPVTQGTYLVSVERDGVFEKRVVDLTGSAPTIDVPITEAHVPMVYVFVATAVGRSAPPSNGPDTPDFGLPRGYSGLVEIPVQTASRTITLSIANGKDSYLPGSDATVTLKAMRGDAPVQGAEIALVAADRGVLDVIDYRIPNPVDFFYSRGNFPDRVAHVDSRDLLMDPVTWKSNDLPGGDEKGEAAPSGLGNSVRKDFNPTAVFRTGLMTGKDGTVTVRFKLPDQLTRFRSTAVAVKDDAFGIVEGEILVQNPINVRTALPRRMRIGDAATAGVVLTDIDGKAHTVEVSIAAHGIDLAGVQKKSVTLKPGATVEVAFDLAAQAPGTAQLTFSIASDVLNERLEDSFPILDEHISESFTIVGKTAATANEALTIPPAFMGAPEEGLYLTLDSTIASALAGAVHYLDIYPFDCLEQVTSKLFARVLFPTLTGNAAADLTTLTRFANPDGGFSYWDDPAPRSSNYYVSLRVAHLLAAAKERGLRLPDDIDTDALLTYLNDGWENMSTYLQSYAVYVMSLWDQADSKKTDALAALGDKIGVFGYGFLGLAYEQQGNTRAAQAALTRLKNFVRVGTRTVTLVGTVDDWFWYGGNVQAKALLLMLYARLQPDSQLVLGLANDLLATNSTGYWENTSNAAWVLQAFAELIAKGNETNADFTASVKLGTTEILKNRFHGLSRAPFSRQIATNDLTGIAAKEKGTVSDAGTTLPLSFGLSGKGTLYYTAELRYALPAVGAAAREEGLGISREILDEKGVTVDGTTLALGSVYTMRLVFYTAQDRTFLALRAPLPSGAEPIDGSLLTSQIVRAPANGGDTGGGDENNGSDTQDNGAPGSTTRIYDSEVRFFFDEVPRGMHEVSFLFRATTPGVYPTPPVQGELMYQPEVFGRTAGVTYQIK